MNKSKENKIKKDRMKFVCNLRKKFRGYRSGRNRMKLIYKRNKNELKNKDTKKYKEMKIESKMKNNILMGF